MLGAERGRQRERDIEPVRRQEACGAVRPFQQHHGVPGQVVEAELGELAGPLQAVKVGMHHGKARQLVESASA